MSKSKHYRDEVAIKEFGRKVRAMRKTRNLTIEQFANEVGLEVTQLARIERGETNVTISYVYRIASVFGVQPKVFFE